MTEAEYQALLRAAAGGAGRGVSLARFITEAALTAAGEPRTASRAAAPSRLALAEIMDAVAAVNRVGNNLNQLAREKNATGQRPVGTVGEVERARTALQRLAEKAERSL
ncbi:hypothetical protein Kisp01_50160 [Kineosporia sp. NBRC 101677]|uniref:hypothetical protein n=1 Tax=Kineosporia sp. NBRC 101677 TaxID=3032197 RepID=UPI0024A11761|nr:hypothetical protein [Kineosporia sp. NBRC 101677]GLY18002.1 hypothetical protein Kisp01_50160 [Kineosporia sp. NBRC 101677]